MMKYFVLYLFLLFPIYNVHAQKSFGGQPRSFTTKTLGRKQKIDIPIISLSPVNLFKLYEEDNFKEIKGKPSRIGVTHKVEYDLKELASCEQLSDGGQLYTLGFYSKNALGMSASFKLFNIPAGGELFLYNGRKDFVIGKFTSENALDDKSFYTQKIEGDTLILEYYEPKNVTQKGQILIDGIGHFYKMVMSKTITLGLSGKCEINAVCAEGNDWRDQIRSVVYYDIHDKSGDVYNCTGTLLNNTKQNKKQYFLSAYHCQHDLTVTKWVFYFNYQTNACNGTIGVKDKSVIGAIIRAKNSHNDGSDFLLLEITTPIPDEYNVYYAGWDRSATPTVGSCVHHPMGDWKKISIPLKITLTDIYKDFWEVGWISESIAKNKGVTERGSSGAPFFNANKRVIGQLWGGDSDCNLIGEYDYYGKFSVSWNGSSDITKSLKSWLDPDNTNVEYLDGVSAVISVHSLTKPFANLSIYPNPAKDYITINTSFLTVKAICKIYNITGEEVYNAILEPKEKTILNVSHLKSGAYIVDIVTGNTEKFSSQIMLTK